MHVTVAEAAIGAALGGAVITALGSAVTGLIVLRSSQDKSHLARLWECRNQVYEAILSEVHNKGETRDELMEGLLNGITNIPKLKNMLDSINLAARLEMYGSKQVGQAFVLCMASLMNWSEAATELSELDLDSIADEEIGRRVGIIEELNRVSLDAEYRLAVIIQKEVQNGPKYALGEPLSEFTRGKHFSTIGQKIRLTIPLRKTPTSGSGL